MRKIDERLKRKMDKAINEVRNFLPSHQKLSKEEATKIIQRYNASIEVHCNVRGSYLTQKIISFFWLVYPNKQIYNLGIK